MDYCIAYKGKDGSVFDSFPWLLNDFDSLEEASQTKERLLDEGFQEVTIFKKDRNAPEEISWEYIFNHICDLFNELIKETYKLRKYGAGFVGILYTAPSSVGFQRIDDIDEFIEKYKPDMLLLKSMEDDIEIEVYRSNLESYHIDKRKRILCIKFKNSSETEINY